MVWKLLRKNISAGQIIGYALANLVGLAIVLCAVRFYGDVRSAFTDEESVVGNDYLVISKKVSGLGTVAGLASGSGRASEHTEFGPEEIARLGEQPWVKGVGEFTAADFNVQLSVSFGGHGMSTYLFLEAIPDDYLDISPSDWHFDPSAPSVPIIMSKDYLALYNFGFAATRGLPQLSENMIGMVPLVLKLTGNGRSVSLPARIVGFSSRLNTIAVPLGFLDWANGEFGNGTDSDPSRLIVRVGKPGDPAIERYMAKNGYEVAGDKAAGSKASYFLTLVTAIVVSIGAVISLLAFFILMLSIFLLLQKNRQKLHDLMLLGYSPMQVSRPYFVLVGLVNLAVLVLAVAAMLSAAAWWQPRLAELSLEPSSAVPAILTGVCIMAVVTAVNLVTIATIVRRNF